MAMSLSALRADCLSTVSKNQNVTHWIIIKETAYLIQAFKSYERIFLFVNFLLFIEVALRSNRLMH
jgi:hypothetical protein